MNNVNTTKKDLPTPPLGEHGIYTMLITDDLTVDPLYRADKEPISTYLPLIIAAAILAGLAVAWPMLVFGYNRWIVPSNKRFSGSFENAAEREAKKKKRIVSLDVFRGMCITIMVFVNYGGGGYWFFNHSLWNGLTVADLVFPWFIMIMGVAMPLSFQALMKNDVTPLQILAKVVRRAIILFALGMYINNGANILFWRIPGVLQRFAVAYLVTGLVILFVPTIGRHRRLPSENLEETDKMLNTPSMHLQKFKSHFFPFAFHWAIALLLLSLWFIITFFLPVPGCPRGYIGPGGYADQSRYWNCTGGAALYIDKMVFGENHIFDNPTCKTMYNTGSYDPEGLLGNLTSIFLCFLGVLAGRILQVHTAPRARIWRWMVWGVVFCSLAAVLCRVSQNDGWIPVNKNLWSASFVLLMGGGGFIVFSLCFVLVDVWRVWNGSPFIYVGMNPIIVYVGHETLGEYFPYSFYTSTSYAYHSLTLASNILGVTAWVTIAYLMYRKQFFVNI
jgi:heparan-alpha-glucosaminide N-acetyltransferase